MSSGTRLSLTKIRFHANVTWSEAYYIFTLRDGPSEGKMVCANELLTRDEPQDPGAPNDHYLQLVR